MLALAAACFVLVALPSAALAIDSPPVANEDSYSTDEDTTLTVPAETGVLANDTDDDNDPLTAALVTGPAHGTLAFNADGSFTYTPGPNYNGSDSFTYTANDGTVDSDAATVSLTVDAVNDAPVAMGDSYSTDEDTPLNVPASGVLGNDTDIDGDALTAAVADEPAHGTVTLEPDGSFSYTPDPDYAGSDSFTYTANDGTEDSLPATVNIMVDAVNDAPVAVEDSYSSNEDEELDIAAPGVLSNDSDVDADTLTADLVSGPTHASAFTLNADGSFTYTPTANYNGSDSFTYQANDGTVDSNTVTVSLTVNAVNDAPVANPDSATTDEDNAVNVDVVANDTDVENDTLTPVIVANPSHGSVTVNPDRTVTYTPTPNYNGTDSFTYQADDGTDDSNTVTVSLTINAVNDAPHAADDTETVQTGGDLDGNVLTNDTDVEGDALTATKQSDPAHGHVDDVNPDGSYHYTPDAGYTGADSFTYTANDGQLDSNTGTVHITVTAVDQSPTAIDDTGSTDEDTPLSVPAPGVLGNDNDPESHSLTAAKVTDPQHGTATVGDDGAYTYTPDPDFNGTDSFTYSADDGTSEPSTANVTITVNPVDDAPRAADDDASVNEDAGATGLGVRSNDQDVDGDAFAVTSASDPAHGTTTVTAGGGDVTYAPDPDYCNSQSGGTPDTFTYTLNGGDTATVSVIVLCADDAPVARDDASTIAQGAAATPVDVLANDTDVDGGPKQVGSATQAAHGNVAVSPSGVTYRPDSSYCNTQAGGTPDTFTYALNGGSQATVSVTVNCLVTTSGGPGETPVFASARLTNPTFAVDRSGPAETPVSARAKKGTTFVYSLSEDARVLFKIEQRTTGRRVGKKCQKTTKRNKSRRKCTRYVTIGSFAQDGKKGTNRKKFSGKIGRKVLRPSRYRATLTATDKDGNASKVKRLNFRVVAR